MATNDAMTTAAEFGYTAGFFNIDPKLKQLLAEATKGGYSQARFVGILQNTPWFRRTAESMRKYEALKVSDPATLQEQLNTARAHILNVGGTMGAFLSPGMASHLAQQAISQGWSEDQLKLVLDGMLTVHRGSYQGQAGAFQQQFKSLAGDYGVNISDATMGQWVKQAVIGNQDVNSVHQQMMQYAKSKYAALADRIDKGETVKQIADPYLQSYGKILEVNPQDVSLFDPLIQRALTAKGPKNEPTTQSLYDFENTLRNDPRWAKTQNAQDVMSSTARSILTDFGLQ